VKLTDKELEIMSVLWDIENPMAAAEIIDSSNNRTWKKLNLHHLKFDVTKRSSNSRLS